MVSAQCLALCVVAVMVAVSAANLGSGKCKPEEDAMKKAMGPYTECYEEVTGKPFDRDTIRKEDGPTKEEKATIEVCVAKKLGIIDANDQLDVDAAKNNLENFEIDDETKNNIEAAFDECKTAGGDAATLIDCVHGAISKNCKA